MIILGTWAAPASGERFEIQKSDIILQSDRYDISICFLYIYIHIIIYIYMYWTMFKYRYVCMYVCMYIYICIYICIYIYIYIGQCLHDLNIIIIMIIIVIFILCIYIIHTCVCRLKSMSSCFPIAKRQFSGEITLWKHHCTNGQGAIGTAGSNRLSIANSNRPPGSPINHILTYINNTLTIITGHPHHYEIPANRFFARSSINLWSTMAISWRSPGDPGKVESTNKWRTNR